MIEPTLAGAFHDVTGWFEVLRTVVGLDITPDGQASKVKKEASEYADNPCIEELADVFITMAGACQVMGWSLTDLSLEVHRKMVINRQRNWEKQADGSYQHT